MEQKEKGRRAASIQSNHGSFELPRGAKQQVGGGEVSGMLGMKQNTHTLMNKADECGIWGVELGWLLGVDVSRLLPCGLR